MRGEEKSFNLEQEAIMPITLNTVDFSQDSFQNPNKVSYTSSGNSFTEKDSLSLGRTAPKPTSTFRGVAKSEVKRTKTMTLDDSTLWDAIVTVNIALPVGIAEADATALLNDVGDFLISADATTLAYNHDITY
jgi:hypothetical protein